MHPYSRTHNGHLWGEPAPELVFPEISFEEPMPEARVMPAAPEPAVAPARAAPAQAVRQDAALWHSIASSAGRLPEVALVVCGPGELRTALQAQMDRPLLRTGTALVAQGLVSQAQLDEVVAQTEVDAGLPIGERLVRAGCLSREALQAGLLRRMAYPLVDLARYPTEVEVLKRLPMIKALELGALPLAMHEQQLVVVMTDPSCIAKLNELKFMLQRRILPALPWRGDLPMQIKSIYARHRLGGTDDRWAG